MVFDMIILMEWVIGFGLFMVGASLGSFAGAQVWRNRARQLDEEKKAGEKVKKKEFEKLSPLLGKKVKDDRSVCLSCGHQLAWYDMLPVVSWLGLGGRCRYCKKFIGWTEFLLEVALGGLFVTSWFFWTGDLNNPLEVVKLALWLVALVALAVNFVYDFRWSLLLTHYNWILIGSGVFFGIITILQSADWTAALVSLVLAVLILGGLYALLWWISGGRWVGEGDMYLGAGLGLFLASWPVAFVALFAANLVGVAIILPAMITGKIKRGSHVPLGPLLILGGVLAWFFGNFVVDWYMSLVFLA